jgi:hypothetical protein
MPLQYRLRVRLREVIAELLKDDPQPTAEKFVNALPARWQNRLNYRHLRDAVKGDWEQFSRDELILLFNMSQRLLGEPFIEAVGHPLWADFFAAQTIGFVDRDEIQGRYPKQVVADTDVLRMFSNGTNKIDVDERTPADHTVIPELLRTRNGLYIGGPKLNRYTEAALCNLIGGTPLKRYDRSVDLPFTFQWNDPVAPQRPSFFAVEVDDRPRGLTIRRGRKLHHLMVPESSENIRRGREVGACVIARHSTAKRTVTSIILAGVTSASTRLMAEALLVDRLPNSLLEVQPGSYGVFYYDYIWEREKPQGAIKAKGKWLESDADITEAAAFKALGFEVAKKTRKAAKKKQR